MKYYSEITGELFDTVEELRKSEQKIREKEQKKEEAKKEMDAALKECTDAWDRYLKVCEKYGVKRGYVSNGLFEDLFNSFFD